MGSHGDPLEDEREPEHHPVPADLPRPTRSLARTTRPIAPSAPSSRAPSHAASPSTSAAPATPSAYESLRGVREGDGPVDVQEAMHLDEDTFWHFGMLIRVTGEKTTDVVRVQVRFKKIERRFVISLFGHEDFEITRAERADAGAGLRAAGRSRSGATTRTACGSSSTSAGRTCTCPSRRRGRPTSPAGPDPLPEELGGPPPGAAMKGSWRPRAPAEGDVSVLPAISTVPAAEWDALFAHEVELASPFVRHAFLAALEESGSATPATGWSAAPPAAAPRRAGWWRPPRPGSRRARRVTSAATGSGPARRSGPASPTTRSWCWACRPRRPPAGASWWRPASRAARPWPGWSRRRWEVVRAEEAGGLHVLFTPAEEALELERGRAGPPCRLPVPLAQPG